MKPNKAGTAFLDSDQDKKGNKKWDWTGKRREPSNLQKRRMVARTIEIAVSTILSNHLYQMDGKVFRQQAGGPIGLEITGVLSRLVVVGSTVPRKVGQIRYCHDAIQEVCG